MTRQQAETYLNNRKTLIWVLEVSPYAHYEVEVSRSVGKYWVSEFVSHDKLSQAIELNTADFKDLDSTFDYMGIFAELDDWNLDE